MSSSGFDSFAALSTEEKIIIYKSRFGSFVNRKENRSYYLNLLESLMTDAYIVPVKKRLIPEEDASGFLLYLSDSIKDMVDDFNNEAGKWDGYFYAFIKNRYVNYKRKTERLKLWENAVIKAVTLSSLKTFDSVCADGYAEKDSRPLALKKLLYIFHTSPVARENFYIYLLAYAASFSDLYLNDICYTFAIDRSQNQRLVKMLGIQIEREKIESRREYLKYRSNYNLNQAIFAEIDLYRARKYNNKEAEKNSLKAIDVNLSRQSERIMELTKLQPRAKETAVTKLLSLNRGTVSSKIFYARQLLRWAVSSDDQNYPDFLKRKTVENFKNGSWEKQLDKMSALKLFKPFEVFDID